jgi:hypothetical protein
MGFLKILLHQCQVLIQELEEAVIKLKVDQ